MLVQFSQKIISLLNSKELNQLTTERYPFKRLMISIITSVIPIISNVLIMIFSLKFFHFIRYYKS